VDRGEGNEGGQGGHPGASRASLVGKNFQDHYIARMSWEVRGIETLNERGRGLSFAGEVVRYLASETGMLTYSASLCAAAVRCWRRPRMCNASSPRCATGRG